jgi:hypothetical protein
MIAPPIKDLRSACGHGAASRTERCHPLNETVRMLRGGPTTRCRADGMCDGAVARRTVW